MQPEPFDLAVIGAGIVGAMAAYMAGRMRADWRIALLDRSLVGGGATQYSAGLDLPYGHTALKKRLAAESIRIYQRLKTELPELPSHSLPFFGVVSRKRVAAVIAGFTQDSIRVASAEQVSQLRRRYPELTLAADQVLIAGGSCSYGCPKHMALALTHWFREYRRGVCWEGVEIQAVRRRRGAFALMTSDGRTISAQRVLVTTGPWMLEGPGATTARRAGVRLKKVAALHIDRCPQPDDPVLYFFDDDAFLLPVYERRQWLLSFHAQEWDCLPEISRLQITADDRTAALAVLHRYCPTFAAYGHSGRVFCDAYSRDGTPLIREAPGTTDLVVAGACSGSGYRLAPGIAQAALRLLSGFPQ